jgi:hypothetical protein
MSILTNCQVGEFVPIGIGGIWNYGSITSFP